MKTLKTPLKTRFAPKFAKLRTRALALALLPAATMASAMAGTTGNMPWDSALTALETDISGPVAHALLLIAIIVTGLAWGFGEHGSSMRKVMGIAAGGAIALGASSLITGLGLTSGALIGF